MSATSSKKNLTVNLYTMKNISKLKYNLIMEKSTQIFTIIKYQKKTSQCICLSVILINSVYSKDKNYHPRAFLEECKYVFKRNKTSKFITTVMILMILIKKILMEKIQMKKILIKKIEYRFFFFFFFQKIIRNFLDLWLESSIL